MTISTMVVSRDWSEVSVLECILGGMHIRVDVESQPLAAQQKLMKSKVDALIVDYDLEGASSLLRAVQEGLMIKTVPLVLMSGVLERKNLERAGASFVFEKPISVDQAVHTLSAAHNMILDSRLRYYRHQLVARAALTFANDRFVDAHLLNVSQSGIRIQADSSLPKEELLSIQFELPGTKTSLDLQGEVAWSDREGHAGIRFSEVSVSASRQLRLWLERKYLVN
ncbi:MAG: PilZ domain-containing protein [Acidobacteriaceae bacterium]